LAAGIEQIEKLIVRQVAPRAPRGVKSLQQDIAKLQTLRALGMSMDVGQALRSPLPGLGGRVIEMDGALEGDFGGLGERF
jgi:hypothetical protein